MPELPSTAIKIGSTLEWFEKAVPEPTEKNANTQIGVHFEEVAEMLEVFQTKDPGLHVRLKTAYFAMHGLAEYVKENGGLYIRDHEHIRLLDALCDQIVTAVGVGHMLSYDILAGVEEVNASNWSKFVDGEPVFDGNKKIQKGPNYFRPALTTFTNRH